MREAIKINSSRAKLISRKYKPTLESLLGVSLNIDEESVVIEGEAENVYVAKPIIEAIGRGFSLDIALKLRDPDYALQIEDLRDYCNTASCMERLRARVIGRQGSIKTTIERATDTYISVFGHTVAVIGPVYSIGYALDAVRKILRGGKHSSVLNYLADVRKRLFYEKLSGR